MKRVDACQGTSEPDQADLGQESIAGDGDHAHREAGQSDSQHQGLVGVAEVDCNSRDDLDNAAKNQASLPSNLL